MKISRKADALEAAKKRGRAKQVAKDERPLLMLGRLLAESVKARDQIQNLKEVEFKVFSQWGDDGIIQWLVHNLDFPETTFIEFGVQNYRESNTRFLMMNDNWTGFVMDGSSSNVEQIVGSEYFWKYELAARSAFIDAENINGLIASSGLGHDVGILHIDLDGNDYWIWKAIDVISPLVVILEYNSVFGPERAITVPYDPKFNRTRAHFSNLYWGASLPALHHLSTEKGYAFIGCNSAGNNAYFIRRDKLNDRVREVSIEQGYVLSRLRDSRDEQGKLTCLTGNARAAAVRGLPVFNVITESMEVF
ncbi:MAG TPA: hypothetical protein PLT67_02500 [Kiritimatiellia bacterium]|nr:hypothetical protein [Kiritimatiellia bacterium]HQQ03688.1 hypothetical protein [Kiritimatiellia bacterium]